MLDQVEIGSLTIETKHLLLTAVMAVLSLYPVTIARFSATPIYLGLPSWYWIAAGVIAVIYLIQLYILFDLDRKDTGSSHEDEDATPGGL